jgi:hypothetical protein
MVVDYSGEAIEGHWRRKTLAMAASLADHVWTMREWITMSAFNDVKTPPLAQAFQVVCSLRQPGHSTGRVGEFVRLDPHLLHDRQQQVRQGRVLVGMKREMPAMLQAEPAAACH